MELRLRQVRTMLKCRQVAFATILGVTPATYCKYEHHIIPITAAQLARLSEATGVPIEEFYEREPVAPANGDHNTHD
jgi:transcriptional regulator with XRE-family HTH domain